MQTSSFCGLLDRERSATRAPVGGGNEDLTRAFEEQLHAFQQVEQALSRVDRHVKHARGDPPLRAFWRGVERDLEEEAYRLAIRIGEEAHRLSRLDPSTSARVITEPASEPELARA